MFNAPGLLQVSALVECKIREFASVKFFVFNFILRPYTPAGPATTGTTTTASTRLGTAASLQLVSFDASSAVGFGSVG